MQQFPLPSAIEVERYKCFARPARLDIKPLTLLYGPNNAGKSALLGALPWIASRDAFETQSFNDIFFRYANEDDDQTVSISLSWTEGNLAHARYTLRSWGQLGHVVLQSLELTHRNPEFKPVVISLDTSRQDTPNIYKITGLDGGTLTPRQIVFGGMGWQSIRPIVGLPLDDSARIPLFHDLMVQQNTLEHQLRALTIPRLAPPTPQPLPQEKSLSLSNDGHNAGVIAYNYPDILEHCNQFLSSDAFKLNRRAIVEPIGDACRVRLLLPDHASSEKGIDLADCGTGLQQLFPVLIGLGIAKHATKIAPSLLFIEEPETSLHPAQESAFAQHLCRTVASNLDHSRIVVETHSEALLLNVQLAITTGILKPSDVNILWIHQNTDGASYVDPISVQEKGYLGHWPQDVFTPNQTTARDILQQRRARPAP